MYIYIYVHTRRILYTYKTDGNDVTTVDIVLRRILILYKFENI